MANKTLKQMRELIVANNPEIVGSELFTEPYLNELINNAQLQVQMNLAGLALDRFRTKATLNVTDGNIIQGYYTSKACSIFKLSLLTNRLKRPKAVVEIQTVNTMPMPDSGNIVLYGLAKEVDRDAFFDLISNPYGADMRKPIFMMDGLALGDADSYLYLYPQLTFADNADKELGQIVVYYRRCLPLSTDASTIEIPEEYEIFIYKMVNVEIQASLGQIQKKDEAIQELMMKLQKAQDDFIANMNPAISNEIAPIGEGAKLQ